MLLLSMLTGLASASPSLDTELAWAVGPSLFYTLPGAVGGVQKTLSPSWSGLAELHAEGLPGARRIGVRAGASWTPNQTGLHGWYVGPRVGTWRVWDDKGATLALNLSAVGGRRHVTESGWLLQAGAGVTRPLVLSGDSSNRLPLPVVELRVGRAIGRTP